MGVSTDGQLSFGVTFEEGFEFPWDFDHNGDIESWWLDVRGFLPSVPRPWTKDGDYAPGFIKSDPRITEWLSQKSTWLKANPIPVEVVNYCSGDYPLYLLATRHTENYRGYPKKIDPHAMLDTRRDAERLKKFMDEWGIENDQEPAWWLSSYWG